MKQLIIGIAVALSVLEPHQATAQSSGAAPAFGKGSKTIGVALGLGTGYNAYYGYFTGVTQSPSLNIVYDQGFFENKGPGTIGIGGVLSYASSRYSYGGNKEVWHNIILGVRATYHLTLLKDKNNKFDPYGGVTLGFRINRYTDNWYPEDNETNAYPTGGVFVGAKYNFAKNFGVFSEVGYDISFFRIGLNLNF